MKYLITNADDYGYRSDISQAIVDSHNHGVLTSTTVLVNFVSNEDVTLALKNPSLKLGLHLNLTSGEPISETWKNTYGSFSRPYRNQPQQFDQEQWLSVFGQYKTEIIFEEYEAQFLKFKELFNMPSTHLDSHHYTSSFSSSFPAFIQLAQKYNLPIRRPKIWAKAADQHPMGNLTDIPELDKLVLSNHVQTTNIFSLQYLNRHQNYLQILEEELSKVADDQSIEVSFHPGYEEEWRQKDLEILKTKATRELIERMGFDLISFDKLI